jgi:hypothetical protein
MNSMEIGIFILLAFVFFAAVGALMLWVFASDDLRQRLGI